MNGQYAATVLAQQQQDQQLRQALLQQPQQPLQMLPQNVPPINSMAMGAAPAYMMGQGQYAPAPRSNAPPKSTCARCAGGCCDCISSLLSGMCETCCWVVTASAVDNAING